MTLSCESNGNFVINELQLKGFRTLAYEHLSKLYAYDINSKTKMLVANFYSGVYGFSVSQLSFNPSGTEVVFAVHSSSHPERLCEDSLIKCDLMSGNVERLAIDGDAFRCPKWSPDGKMVAFFFRNQDGVEKLGILEQTPGGMLSLKWAWDAPATEASSREMWWTQDGAHLLVNKARIVYERVGRHERVEERIDSTAKINIITGEREETYRDVVVFEGVDKSRIIVVGRNAIYFEDKDGRKELLFESAESMRFFNTTRGGEFVIFFKETLLGRSIHVIHVPSRRSCRLYTNRMWSGSYFSSLHLLKRGNLPENVILQSDLPGMLREKKVPGTG